MSIVMPAAHAELHTPRVMLSGSLSGMLELERETSLTMPCGRDLRKSFSSHSRSRSGHWNGPAAPLPSPRYSNSSRGNPFEDMCVAGVSGMQSQPHEYKKAYTRAGCNAFKSADGGCPLKSSTRLPVMRSSAVHSAYRSEFALEIEAQQTPRHRHSRSGSGFGISCAPSRALPETPRTRAIQVPGASGGESTLLEGTMCDNRPSLGREMSEEVASSPHTPCGRINHMEHIPKHLLVPPPAPIKRRKCEDMMQF